MMQKLARPTAAIVWRVMERLKHDPRIPAVGYLWSSQHGCGCLIGEMLLECGAVPGRDCLVAIDPEFGQRQELHTAPPIWWMRELESLEELGRPRVSSIVAMSDRMAAREQPLGAIVEQTHLLIGEAQRELRLRREMETM